MFFGQRDVSLGRILQIISFVNITFLLTVFLPFVKKSKCKSATRCPNGNECPDGEFCYKNLECNPKPTANPTRATPRPTTKPTPSTALIVQQQQEKEPAVITAGSSSNNNNNNNNNPLPSSSSSTTPKPVVPTTSMPSKAPTINTNFCGKTWEDHAQNCDRSKPCPRGDECGLGEKCFSDSPCSRLYQLNNPISDLWESKVGSYCGTEWNDLIATVRNNYMTALPVSSLFDCCEIPLIVSLNNSISVQLPSHTVQVSHKVPHQQRMPRRRILLQRLHLRSPANDQSDQNGNLQPNAPKRAADQASDGEADSVTVEAADQDAGD